MTEAPKYVADDFAAIRLAQKRIAAEAILAPTPSPVICAACDGLRFVRIGIDLTTPCPACGPKRDLRL